jgi:hypothetical protein
MRRPSYVKTQNIKLSHLITWLLNDFSDEVLVLRTSKTLTRGPKITILLFVTLAI